MHITQAYFSPGGTSRAIVEYFTSQLDEKRPVSLDLLRHKEHTDRRFGPDDLLVVNMPVFAGRLPLPVPAMLSGFKAQRTPAVALVTYGNREYEDALLELCDILSSGGFEVIGAAAFIARHSIFPRVAADRPDDKDKQKIAAFAAQCASKLATTGKSRLLSTRVNGNRPYRDIPPIPFKPNGDDACNDCGLCVELCPVQAIDPATPRQTDPERCISCTACVYNCPQHARSFRGPAYERGLAAFLANLSARREPEVFG